MPVPFSGDRYAHTPLQNSAAPASKPTSKRHQVGKIHGLVYSQPSDTAKGPIQLDPHATRLLKMRRRVITAARLHVSQLAGHEALFYTLTYRNVGEWSPLHISNCLKHIRHYLARLSIAMRYVWVAEMQKRGAIHYHVVLFVPQGMRLPFLDDRGWWPHGLTRVERARNAVGYIAKYASKGSSDLRLPSGARMYGSGGLTGPALLEARWWSKPTWLRLLVPPEQDVQPAKGGGWVDCETGELFISPWEVHFVGGRVLLQRKPERATGAL